MNGIDKITQRIGADTQAEIDRILADAAAQAEAAADKFRTQAEAEDRDLLAKSERAAAEREERLVSAAQMEARKTLLTAKQEMVERAYQRALEKLRSLPQEQYVELLAALLVRASSTGREEVVFSPEDREGAGKAAVARANELLAKEAAPELPLGDGVVANLLNKVAAGVSAFAQGTAMLAVSEETRDISGGFILKDGRIEVNWCARSGSRPPARWRSCWSRRREEGGVGLAKTIKDTDYLVISARVKALETGLLTAERMEQILDAKSGEDAGKLLQEWGYPQLDPRRPEAMDAALSAVREATLADLAEGTPDARYIDLFKVKYDYHNVKALLKAEAVGTAPDRMLMDMGRVSTAELAEAVRSRELDGLPETLAAAVAEAREVLDTTRDPQLSDIVLDRWCYRDMAALAEETGSAFLRGYVAVQVDAVNLRTAVRTLRMGKGADFLLGALLEGGDLAPDAVAKAASSGAAGLRELYGATRFRDAAEAGAEALKGGPLTAFEKLCDDAVGDYLAGAQSVPFGEAPLVSYLAARETEYTNLRILLMGRAAGIDPAVIRTRLRASYV